MLCKSKIVKTRLWRIQLVDLRRFEFDYEDKLYKNAVFGIFRLSNLPKYVFEENQTISTIWCYWFIKFAMGKTSRNIIMERYPADWKLLIETMIEDIEVILERFKSVCRNYSNICAFDDFSVLGFRSEKPDTILNSRVAFYE